MSSAPSAALDDLFRLLSANDLNLLAKERSLPASKAPITGTRDAICMSDEAAAFLGLENELLISPPRSPAASWDADSETMLMEASEAVLLEASEVMLMDAAVLACSWSTRFSSRRSLYFTHTIGPTLV